MAPKHTIPRPVSNEEEDAVPSNRRTGRRVRPKPRAQPSDSRLASDGPIFRTPKGPSDPYAGHDEYRVAKIVAKGQRLGAPAFLVRWEGLPEKANTYELVANVGRQDNWKTMVASWEAEKVAADEVSYLPNLSLAQVPSRLPSARPSVVPSVSARFGCRYARCWLSCGHVLCLVVLISPSHACLAEVPTRGSCQGRHEALLEGGFAERAVSH